MTDEPIIVVHLSVSLFPHLDDIEKELVKRAMMEQISKTLGQDKVQEVIQNYSGLKIIANHKGHVVIDADGEERCIVPRKLVEREEKGFNPVFPGHRADPNE